MRLARDLPLNWGLRAGSLVGSQGSREGLGVVAGVDVFGDGEGDSDPDGEGDEIGDELAEADEDAGDELGEGVDDERCWSNWRESMMTSDEGRGFAQGHEVVGEDGRADEILLREIAGGDEDGAAVILEDGGDFGFGEGAVELFGAVVDLGLQVGAEFGEDVGAVGGGEVIADGLEVAGQEVGAWGS